MLEGDSNSLRSVLLGWVGVDLFLRYDTAVQFVAELLGFGTSVGIVVPFVLGVEYVLDLSALRALFGWGLFWLVLFVGCPLVFPKTEPVAEDWTVELSNRLLVASAAVGVGLTIEGWIAVLETRINYGGVVSPTVVVSPVTAVGIVASVLLGY